MTTNEGGSHIHKAPQELEPKPPSSEGPTSNPRTSPSPEPVTPIAITTAVDTIRPYGLAGMSLFSPFLFQTETLMETGES